jgi:curved DNA-binding protein CbpA
MPDLHTHYDNLKVARNAPPEVIRAAYRTLSQKFHPDRNPGNQSATRTFQIINSAYEVLSDPEKRREHDRWIARVEGARSEQHTSPPARNPVDDHASTRDQSWQRQTSFVIPLVPRHPFFRPLRQALRGGLTRRQAISCICASCAATLVLFALLASH